ncbi:DNA-binding protein [Fusobacterium animalis]|uniref:DNA-binding protein n=1 Tax=Fusobacterium animalis TaxID=76859 RepID=A0A2G9FFY8_9FUSO|nr:DNA-binding protein [Fusobacterium animalis]PIM91801.1 DNA-binding protein [Fusobacterium animalis]
MKKFYIKFLKSLLYISFTVTLKSKKQKLNDYFSRKFLEINNDYVLKKIKKKINDKILILLPHCIQLYDCEYKITSDINNCRHCGKCVVSNFIDIKNKFQNIEVKIATGGTLARKYIKEIKPILKSILQVLIVVK